MNNAFAPGYEAVAAMPFTFAGVKYAKGTPFPYRDLGIIDFDLRGLWLAERIEFTGKPLETKAGVAKPPQQNQVPARR